MPYIASDGTVQTAKPFGVGFIVDLFWGTVTFVNLFVRTLFHLDDVPSRGQYGSGGRAPRTPGPGRRMGGLGGASSVAAPPCSMGG